MNSICDDAVDIAVRMRFKGCSNDDVEQVLGLAAKLSTYMDVVHPTQVTSNIKEKDVECECERVGIRCIKCGECHIRRNESDC